MGGQPSGTVTFLFSDIEGSTRLLHELGPEAYREALAEHRRLMREAFGRHGGYEVDYEGDAFFVAFQSAAEALTAAAEAQEALADGAIRVRMGLHTGEPLLDPPKYVGVDVHRAARIMAAGHGGQVLVSRATWELVDTELRGLGEHRLKDFEEPVVLYQLGEGEFPPLKTISNTNLPRPASSFVGRDSELADVVARLRAPEVRLLTLTGPGGTGKTRLAIEAAGELLDEFAGGAWFVDLAPLRDPELVESTIAHVTGAEDELVAALRSRELLLVLDNFEQVTPAAPVAGALLTGCPALKMLVTSRTPLRVGGEHVLPLSPLDSDEAVELFVERSLATVPDFEPDDSVPEICERLDRLPLAIELAAARVRLLPPAELLARLEQRLSLLSRGARDAPARHQALEATIAWSYELLRPEEQRLFSGLAVFNGGCRLEAIEAVCNPEGEYDVLTGVEALLDGSLLREERGEDGNLGFVMLETIHDFARARLEESADALELRRLHAHFFCDLALAAGPKLFTEDDAAVRPRLEQEVDNFRAALDWLAVNEPLVGFDMTGALAGIWLSPGRLGEGQRRLEQALARAPREPTRGLFRVLTGLSNVHFEAGVYESSRPFCERAVGIARALDDQEGLAGALMNLGVELLVVGELDGAVAHLEEAAQLAEQLDDRRVLAEARANLAWVALVRGDYEVARRLGEELLALVQDMPFQLAATFCLLGWSLHHLGDPAAADRFRESLAIVRNLSSKQVAECLNGLSATEVAAGRDDRAARLAGLAEGICAAHGIELDPFMRSVVERTNAAARAALGNAEFERLYEAWKSLPPEEAIDDVLAGRLDD